MALGALNVLLFALGRGDDAGHIVSKALLALPLVAVYAGVRAGLNTADQLIEKAKAEAAQGKLTDAEAKEVIKQAENLLSLAETVESEQTPTHKTR
jgi:hypothetical protein